MRMTLILQTEKGQEEVKAAEVILTGSQHPCYQGLNLDAVGLSLNGEVLEYGPGMQTLLPERR
jgi:hypothetical protein